MGAEWIDSLVQGGVEIPDEIKNDPTIQNYGSIQDLMKGHIETKALVGRKGVIVPGKDAKPEEWDAFHTALGRPKTADEYQISQVKMPEGFPDFNPDGIKEFKAVAHKLGMTPQMVDGLWNWYAQSNGQAFSKMQEAQAEAAKATEETLRKDFGDKYDATLALAQKTGKLAFGDDFEAFAQQHGNNPVVIKALAKLGAQLGEDAFVIEGTGSGLNKTPEEAQAEINRIMGDKDHAYHKSGPGHKEAVEHVTKLFNIVYGGEDAEAKS